MPQTTIGSKIHKSFYIHANFAAQITFHFVFVIQDLTNFGYIYLGQLIRIHVRIESDFFHYFARGGTAYAVNVSQSHFHSFISGEINPCNSGHSLPPGDTLNAAGLTLALFVFRVFADHPDYSFSLDNLAFITNLFYRRPDFHGLASLSLG
jgi:hypothetical protein